MDAARTLAERNRGDHVVVGGVDDGHVARNFVRDVKPEAQSIPAGALRRFGHGCGRGAARREDRNRTRGDRQKLLYSSRAILL